MGGGGASSLNDELSQLNDGGTTVFSKPFGNKTSFQTRRTRGGRIVVTFLFDPNQPYDETHTAASITQDWTSAIRNELVKLLLPKSIRVPKTVSKQETVWANLKSALPKEVLKEYLMADNHTKLDGVVEMITRLTEREYNEEKALTEALQTQPFSLTYAVAIDAYPAKLGTKKNVSTDLDERCGVLYFHIEGIPGEGGVLKRDADDMTDEAATGDDDDDSTSAKKRKMDVADDSTHHGNEAAAAAAPMMPAASSSSSFSSSSSAVSPQNRAPSKLVRSTSKAALKNDQLLNGIVDKLGWSASIFSAQDTVRCKEFPATATDFVDNVNGWFSTQVHVRAAKIEQMKAGKVSLYQ